VGLTLTLIWLGLGCTSGRNHGALLGVIKEDKYLGVIVCQNLKVGKQCFKAASKGKEGKPGVRDDQKNVYKPIKRNNITLVQITGVNSF